MSHKIQNQLRQIIKNHPDSIKSFVANELLEQEHPKLFLNDILNYGCISGAVSSLIYYADTYAFFDRFYDEILEIRSELINDGVIDSNQITDIKNHWAWAAFEYVASNIAYELNL